LWLILEYDWDKNIEAEKIASEAKTLGIKLEKIIPAKCEIITAKKGDQSFYYQGKAKQLPDIILIRSVANASSLTLAVIHHLEQQGVITINQLSANEKSRNKLKAAQVFSANDIPTPKTMLAKIPLDLSFIEQHFNYPLIIKKALGAKGRGVLLVNNSNELNDIIGLFDSKNSNNPELIIQEFITSSRGKDIRVIVIGNKVIGAIMRKSVNSSFKANFSGGGSVEPVELDAKMTELATKATKALGLEIAGVDLLLDGDSYQVCEVNAAPGFEGFSRAHPGVNVAREMLLYLQNKISV
jgi:RimK family alpha-L-glutamate ligase